ncbi:MAG TPA: hypothetical protein VFR35_06650, partial [Actinoplanes sp.]|nr:hypothetical protein [Actinoplanes sp.]
MPAPTRERNGQPSDTVSGMEIPGFRGEVIAAEHADYDDARAVWNGKVDRRPRLIARCTGVADVAAAVRFARDRNFETTSTTRPRPTAWPRPEASWATPASAASAWGAASAGS